MKLLLVRHGRSTANASGILAGRMDGVDLDATGERQAQGLGEKLKGLPIAAAYRSPIARCQQTATLLGFPDAQELAGLTECDYGEWTGGSLKELAEHDLWKQVQATPSSVTFPGGESMAEMSSRSVGCIRELADKHGKGEIVLVVSHGDPIKAILADALATPFDEFQRINVAPASVSVVDYDGSKPFVVVMNIIDDALSGLAASAGPVVGGGDSPDAAAPSPDAPQKEGA